MHKAHLSLADFYVPDFILPTPKKREIYSTIVRVAVHFALILVLQICKGPGHIPQLDIHMYAMSNWDVLHLIHIS